MNYELHYNRLIEKAKNRNLDNCYVESHHIIPKCFGGSNSIDNLANLTAREHYIAHLLLYKIQTNKKKKYQMLKVCIMMAGKNIYNSRVYEGARKQFSLEQSERIKLNTKLLEWPAEKRAKLSNTKKELYIDKENHPWTGRNHTDASKLKNEISNSLIINIYDNTDVLKYTSNGNFGNFCKLHNLPFKAFKKSYQLSGSHKLYCKNGNERIYTTKNADWIQYKGWYAISNKFGHKKEKSLTEERMNKLQEDIKIKKILLIS